MGTEIERKFLVKDHAYRNRASRKLYRQGYPSTDPERIIRIRTDGSKGFLTMKGLSKGAVRSEYEYEIPLCDAEDILAEMCKGRLIEKYRYTLSYEGMTWEVDEFLGDNQGLFVAEIELEQEDQSFRLPPWIGQEVTEDPRYYNANLIKRPYKDWKEHA